MKNTLLFILFYLTQSITVEAQIDKRDSILYKDIDSILLDARLYLNYRKYLPEIVGTFLLTGKKSEIILLASEKTDIENKNARQVFATVPGVFVYDMDGSGNQINIATRGLDPHRGWEFNIRRGGVITNSDLYGYPASHFSMPLESIEKIELIRGTSSIQYGSQFGGMLNYVPKKWGSDKHFSFENSSTLGSYNMVSSYNAIAGNRKKWHYYLSIYKKSRDGYRKIEHTSSHYESILVQYDFTHKINLSAQWARSEYIYRMPGPLTESKYQADPSQSSRSRNYFNPDIHVPSLKLNWEIDNYTKLDFTSSAVLGNRNSVLFDKPSTIEDTANINTGDYNNRQVDIDAFHSYTNEIRILHQYGTNKNNTLVGGFQYIDNVLHRQQLGVGTTGTNFDLRLTKPGWGRDLFFKTKNLSLFTENKWSVTNHFSINTGLRIENGVSKFEGRINYLNNDSIPLSLHHKFPLFSIGFVYKTLKGYEFYSAFSQAYRSMVMKDLIPSTQYEKVDKNIKDATGYNLDLGFRGSKGFLKWDITVFALQINNRYGSFASLDINRNYYTYRTNIGNSFNLGAEIYIEYNWVINNFSTVTFFTSNSIMHDRYEKAKVKFGNQTISVTGNKVESAPDVISRNSLTYRWKKTSIGLLMSFTDETYADALNTKTPSENGATGMIPAYTIFDLNISQSIFKRFEIKASVNNLGNRSYFTKRPMFYPGPGIWPSDGRSIFITLRFKL
jgi:Fe(3+) dicitrate transport protein